MKKDYNKTLRVLHLMRALIDSPNNMINDASFREIMGQPKKASYHKLVKELTEDQGELPALLRRESLRLSDFDILPKTKHSDDNFSVRETFNYYLNESYTGFNAASAQTEFMLECYSRLGSILPDGMQKRLTNVINQKTKKAKNLNKKFCHVKPVAGKDLEPHQKKFLPLLINAVLAQKEIKLTYTGSDNETNTYIYRPYTLCMYRDDLYLLGERLYNKEYEERMCKIRRIKDVTLLESTFKYPLHHDPNGKFQGTSGIIYKREESYTVKVKVFGVSRIAFQDKTFFNNVLLNAGMGDDFDLYEMNCTRFNEFIGQLFVYAQDIEIVDNPKIQQLFIEKAEQAISRNKKLEIKKVA